MSILPCPLTQQLLRDVRTIEASCSLKLPRSGTRQRATCINRMCYLINFMVVWQRNWTVYGYVPYQPIPMAVRSKVQVCSFFIAGIASLNPTCSVLVCCVGNGLCNDLITSSEESYRVFICVFVCVCNCVCVIVCVIVCDLWTSTIRRPVRELGPFTTEEKIPHFPSHKLLHMIRRNM
jgi:tellurite resistance protein TehA-like permease